MQTSVVNTPAELARLAAAIILEEGLTANAERGRFDLVLAGGRTPEAAYAHLALLSQTERLNWSKVHLYLGDERMAPHDDPNSNFALVKRALLSRIEIPAENVHAVDVSYSSAQESAKHYADQLRSVPGLARVDDYPCFDLILLGLGDDGHTASLFPGHTEALKSTDWAVGTTPGTIPPPIDRVTLTLPVLCRARVTAFLVSGEGKAEAVRHVLMDKPPIDEAPSVGVQPLEGKLLWLLDSGASSLLPDDFS